MATSWFVEVGLALEKGFEWLLPLSFNMVLDGIISLSWTFPELFHGYAPTTNFALQLTWRAIELVTLDGLSLVGGLYKLRALQCWTTSP